MFSSHSKAFWVTRSSIVFAFCLVLVAFGSTYFGVEAADESAIAAFNNLTPGFIDANFNPTFGINGGPGGGLGNRTIVQSDGKILVAGNFQVANGVRKNGIARYNSDGTLDVNFNTKSGASGTISAIALQSNGKIIIGGAFTLFGGQTVGNIARLNADGSLDTDFNWGGVYNNVGAGAAIADIAVTSNDSIYIAGSFTSYNGTTINRLARLAPNGNLDTTFTVGTGPGSAPSAVTVANDGKVLISGFFTTYNGTAVPRMARINTDGSLDTSFAIGTGPVGGPSYLKVQADDKILVGGGGATFNSVARNALVRLNSDGSVDTTFNANIVGSSVTSVARQADDKLIIGGSFTTVGGVARGAIARVAADGTLDATFDPGTGLSGNAGLRGIALQSDGKAILVGSFTTYNGTARIAMARTNSDGSLDTGAVTNLTALGSVLAIARQSDGKILIGGTFQSADGAPRMNIARLNPDGSNDPTFNPGTGANQSLSAIAVQTDGKIVISGQFTNYNGTAINRIARLNADGSLDNSFNVGTGIEDGATSIAIQTDGKILISGFFSAYNTVTVNRLARLNTDGTLDTGFATGSSANNGVTKVALQPDGKILIGGDFATFNGTARARIARLNTDGTVDTSFDPGIGFGGRVTDIGVLSDGKIIVSGTFTTFNAIARTRVARLNSNGSLDTSFDPAGAFATGEVSAICPTPDGKYMVVGTFTTVAGLPKNRIARLRSNGTLDPKFLTGLGPAGSGTTLRIIVPHNGRYLIGGQFDTFNTSPRAGLVSISNATKAPVDYDGDGKTDFAIFRHTGGQTPMNYWINYSGGAPFTTFTFGIFTVDGIQPGDFDGDGITDVAVWRGFAGAGFPNGYWVVLSTTNSSKFVPFGLQGDRNVLEDYDGDGKDDMAIWRGPGDTVIGQGTFMYRGSLNNPNGSITYVPFGMRYGTQSDQVDDLYPGDFDGDGRADFRVQRRVDTTVGTLSTPGVFYTMLSSTGAISYDYFGWAGDRTIPGDYDGDGKTDLAISRGFNITPSNTIWYIRYTSGIPDATFHWGAGGLDQFAQGDYDGDGITDPTVYRRAGENNFYVRRSSDQMMQVFHWGQDDPVCGPACDVAVATYNNR